MERQCGGLIVSMKDSFYLRGEETHRGSSGKGSSSMKLNKKATALLLGLTLGISGTAFAADGADSFSDVPQGHWAYDALDYLAKDGVIDGMGDGTFQGNRTMTRYEMASIVAKAMQKGNLGVGDQAVLEKLEKEYGSELATLSKQVNANTKAIKDLNAKTDKFKVWGMTRVQTGDDNGLVKDGRNGTYNNRFYMDLEGSMKINDRMTARFTVEKNAHYRDSEYAVSKIPQRVTVPYGKGYANEGKTVLTDKYISGIDKDSLLGDDNHNGSISNIWVEMQLGPKHDWYTNIGRKWNGVGMQNLMLGGQVDGIATYHPIEGGHGWWLSAQYWKSASDWTNTEVTEWTTDADGNATPSKLAAYSHRAPIAGTLNFWGPLGKYMDLNLAYSRIVSHVAHNLTEANGDSYYSGAKNFYGVDLKVRPIKDFAITGSYLKSDAKKQKWDSGNAKWWAENNADRAWAVRFDYRGTDLNKVGTWGLYAKWMDLGGLADIAHDDEWATREPTYVNGVRGWYFGFKCVPYKNVEWETMWAPHLYENKGNTVGGQYTRHILRSWLDFHF